MVMQDFQFSSVLFRTYSVIQCKTKDNLLTGYMYNRIQNKKEIQFSKHYLVISYDQRYSKSYFNVIRKNSYVNMKLIWKEHPTPVTMSGKRVLVLYILTCFR